MKFTKIFFMSMFVMLMNACGGDSGGGSDAPAPRTTKSMLSYKIGSNYGVIADDKIDVVVPYGTNVKELVAEFATDGDKVKVGSVDQISGTTKNDFTNAVVYEVFAENKTSKKYTVTVASASASAKEISAYSINGVEGVFSGVNSTKISVALPFGTDVKALKAKFSMTGASIKVGSTAQVSEKTDNDFTSPVEYVVTAADKSTKVYTVSVTLNSNSAKNMTLFKINNVEGVFSGENVSVVLPYGTDVSALVASFTVSGVSVKVGSVAQVSGVNANDFTSPIAYDVYAADGSKKTYTVTVTTAANDAKAMTAFSIAGFIGSINEGAKTISVNLPYGSAVDALVATFTSTGSAVQVADVDQVSGQTANDFSSPVTYVVHAADASTESYVVTVNVSDDITSKRMTAFAVQGGSAGVIDENAGTISVKAPTNDLTALVMEFEHDGVKVEVGAVAQVSGQTVNDFSSPVTYVVTAADGSTKTYAVTAVASDEALIASFSIDGYDGVIDDNAETITLTISESTTDVTALLASFTLSPGATVQVLTVDQESGVTPNDFTNAVGYVVTAADGTTTKTYAVSVANTLNNEATLTMFSIAYNSIDYAGVVDDNAGTIAVSISDSAAGDLAALVASFTLGGSGAVVEVASVEQTSGATANDFSATVSYMVTSEDGKVMKAYVVTVTADLSSAKAITAFDFVDATNGQTWGSDVTGTIDEGAKTIALSVPNGTNVLALTADFTASANATVAVGVTGQVSGTTANDFSSPVVYTVTAEDSSFVDYTVTVTIL